MHLSREELVVTATDLSGFLACRHLTSLELAAQHGGPKRPKYDDPGAEVLRRRGEEHEARILNAYRASGLDVGEPHQPTYEERQEQGWGPYAAETLELMRAGVDVIYQGCLFDGRWLGLPDFLIRVDSPSRLGDWSYEVVDAKLSREAKVGAVLQICAYSEMLAAVQGLVPERMHLALGGLRGNGANGASDARGGAEAHETFQLKRPPSTPSAPTASPPSTTDAPIASTPSTPSARAASTPSAPGGPATNGAPTQAHVIPLESFRVADYAAYHRSVKHRFATAIDTKPATYPEPCERCTICDWSSVCDRRWRTDDHLSLVAGITRKQRAALEARATSVTTLEGLAGLPLPPDLRLDGVSDGAYTKIREQARIQLEGRTEGRPKHELLLPVQEKMGLLALPEPSPGDLFFDVESDPHAFGEGLEYLFGWVDAEGEFTALWALDPEAERRQFEAFIDGVIARLERWPDLHVYHYAPYEQTALKRLASRYGTREEELDRLLRGEVLVDLYRVVRQGLRASVESYSIKKLEPLYGFERAVELRAASSALANFEAWLQLGPRNGDGEAGGAAAGAGEADVIAGEPDAEVLLAEIEGYNRDDCISTLRLRNWLEERRSDLEALLRREGLLGGELDGGFDVDVDGKLPRPAPPELEPSEAVEEENERVLALVERLTAGVPDDPADRTDADQAQWLLAHLLSWHRREKKSMWWEYFRLRDLDDDERLHDSRALAALEYVGEVDQVKRSLIHRYRFPAQDFAIRSGDTPHDPRTEKSAGKVVAVDAEGCTIDLKRAKTSDVAHPTSLIPFDDVPDKILRERLWSLADEIVEHGLDDTPNRAAVDLLLRRRPRAGQVSGDALRRTGETNLDAARRIATRLDATVLPIQGPPGSGKTYIGARMIVALMRAGKTVGVTATSHKVIVNLLDDVCRAAREESVTFRGVQKADPERGCQDDSIECAPSNQQVEDALEGGEVDLAAGTVWLWARDRMQGKLDVLFVDEAGQMSLANVLAASGAADSIVLLGDPKQLEQPTQGAHPPATGVAALEHLVGAHTLDPDRGLFLEETWRLHPDVCSFTSELYYDGKLGSRPELARQSIDAPDPFAGVGLRFWPVEHHANSNESIEEVQAIRELVDRLLVSEPMWVDAHGVRQPLLTKHVLVVAPYNAQVTALRAALPAGVPVGTVDKFQGQEAPIVIYSTATSSVADAPRGMEFLFSPNRLNVATSRARCVVVLVGSASLLGPDCGSVRQMRLANGFCRFGEMSEGVE